MAPSWRPFHIYFCLSSSREGSGMLEIMDDRYGKYSTVVVSQLPTEEWYASLGDNTLADAILDRLMHNA
ncbi:MAG: ATP-binding protein, partial [Aeromonas sp.]